MVPDRILFYIGDYCPKILSLIIGLPVISYPGHFVPTLVISYLLFGHFVPSNNHFVPRPFRTHFGHFVPRSTGYEMTIWWSIRTQVISYPFWSFRIHFGHIVPSKDGWMDGLTNGRKDRRVLIEMTNLRPTFNCYIMKFFVMF